ncbi:MAG: hypothetical protein ACK5M1_01390 [Xanthomarina gelatinilytica]
MTKKTEATKVITYQIIKSIPFTESHDSDACLVRSQKASFTKISIVFKETAKPFPNRNFKRNKINFKRRFNTFIK